MNRNEYDTNYGAGSYRPSGRSPYHSQMPYRNAPSLAPSSRNDYDVDSMLSARSLPQHDYLNHWQQRHPASDAYSAARHGSHHHQHQHQRHHLHNPQSQYSRSHSPPHRTSFRDSNYEHKLLDMSSSPPPPPMRQQQQSSSPLQPSSSLPRREYSPMRKMDRGVDGTFKGFTTPLPGNDSSYMAADGCMMDVGSQNSRRYSEVDRASAYRGLSTAGSAIAASDAGIAPGMGRHDLSYAKESNYRYRADGPEYGGNAAASSAAANGSYFDDYPPEPSPRRGYVRGGESAKSRYDDPSSAGCRRNTPSMAGSAASAHRNENYYRPWNMVSHGTPSSSAQCWESAADHSSPTRMGEHPLSPRTFKRECQRAFKEARAQRMRNLEEGLYGKCDWATFDAKYC